MRRPEATSRRAKVIRPLREFLRTEAGSGAVLLAATAAALLWANGPWSASYEDLWHRKLTIGGGSWGISEDLRHWVNDAAMVVFFFLVGLEIKREIAVGELRSFRAATLPALGALGGMLVPALVYLLLTGDGEAGHGWGIPMATDIAFALGVLALLGPRVPGGLKVFLLTLAIIDDIGAIAVIAIFYSSGVEGVWLGAAGAALVATMALRRAGLAHPLGYLPAAAAAWYCTYRAGVHPTIAGVLLGVMTPAMPVRGRRVLEDLEHRLHPWSSYLVIPIFALANAGVHLGDGVLADALASEVSWAVAAGLVLGKCVGVSLFSLAGLRARLGVLPRAVRPVHVVGVGALGGIGFTVALFIAGLAFDDPALEAEAKIGILAASVVSALIGSAGLSALKDPSPDDADLPDEDAVEITR